MEIRENGRQVRTCRTQFTTRDAGEAPVIEGYFVVFGDTYTIGPGMSESVAPEAFDDTLSGDIRALIDHDTRLVLGRTTAGTLALEVRDKGLWGKIDVNPNDVDAMNLYARVQRGDVNQCSFGFDILEEDTDINTETDEVHWTIKKVKLYEVSVCTFPAYEATTVSARQKDVEELKKRSLEVWKERTKERLRGGRTNGTCTA